MYEAESRAREGPRNSRLGQTRGQKQSETKTGTDLPDLDAERLTEDYSGAKVLLKRYRDQVIKLAHDLPLAGHLGREKTTQQILRCFYWPTLFQDVKQYCQSCTECQLYGGRKGRAPLVPLPIIGDPFRQIAMDVVGPLPRTRRGNRFILVVSDYATRYPEAFLLRSVTAAKVAEVLVELFSRHGSSELRVYLNYGQALVPRCPDKRGLSVLLNLHFTITVYFRYQLLGRRTIMRSFISKNIQKKRSAS